MNFLSYVLFLGARDPARYSLFVFTVIKRLIAKKIWSYGVTGTCWTGSMVHTHVNIYVNVLGVQDWATDSVLRLPSTTPKLEHNRIHNVCTYVIFHVAGTTVMVWKPQAITTHNQLPGDINMTPANWKTYSSQRIWNVIHRKTPCSKQTHVCHSSCSTISKDYTNYQSNK